jgi:hypothetical protein
MSIGSRRLYVLTGLFAAVATVGGIAATSSAQPGPTASAGAAPSASASGTAGTAELPVVRGSFIPAGTSDAPKIKEFNDEWSTIGKPVRANRDEPSPCKFTLVREWLRIQCENRLGATMFAGDPKGVKVLAAGGPISDERNRRVTIFLRLEKGTTRMFSLVNFEAGYNWSNMVEAERISVSWREDREDPWILVSKL